MISLDKSTTKEFELKLSSMETKKLSHLAKSIDGINVIKLSEYRPSVATDYLRHEKFTGLLICGEKSRFWFKDGLFHNEYGPAMYDNETPKWWLNGSHYSEEDFNNHPLVLAHKEKQDLEKSINESKQSSKIKL